MAQRDPVAPTFVPVVRVPVPIEGRHFCHRCKRETAWRRRRGGRTSMCEECNDVFPCRNRACGHIDCDDTRRGGR